MINSNRFVISGIGLATPLGCSYDNFWNNILVGKNVTHSEPLYINHSDEYLVSKVQDNEMPSVLDKRKLRKIDRFSALAISAVHRSLEDANLNIKPENADRIGIIIGNAFGGWSYVEHQMYALYQGDHCSVSPYVSTAWFPAAPQGEISIHFGIGGYSKTVSAGTLSAAYAAQYSIELLNENFLDYVLTGATEAPLTGLVYNACIEENVIEENDGYIENSLCEASVMFVIENYKTAQNRGANVYAEYVGLGHGQTLIESVQNCLQEAGKQIEQIDAVILNAVANKELRLEEEEQIKHLFKNKKCYLTSSKQFLGNAIGASMCIDMALACMMLKMQCVPPTKSEVIMAYKEIGFDISTQPISAKLENILINSRNNYGEWVTILLSRVI